MQGVFPVAATKLEKFLGNGLYTVPEAALYARVTTGMMRRWLFGGKGGEAVIDTQFKDDEKLVTFLDFIQTLAIREIRLQRQLPLVKFRQAIAEAKKRFHLTHPFARRHCTYLYRDELVIRPNREKQEYFEASGTQRGQSLFPFVEMYLDDLSFDSNGLANRFQIYTYQASSKLSVPITMDPQFRFGEPLLPSGYTPMAIWDAINAEGGIDRAAKVYGIPKEEAEASYQFIVNHLGKAA
jgi:hypothetical protein